MKCKFPDQPCSNRYDKYGGDNPSKWGKYCRLKEWKKKKGVCHYDSSIHSVVKIKNRKDKNQKILGD